MEPSTLLTAADLADFDALWREASEVWDKEDSNPAFFGYVSADYAEVLASLVELRSQAHTFIEWGSGLGVVTIMASRLGFDAYGIEAEPRLVDYAEEFAHRYAPEAQFAQGSFVPDLFDWNPAAGDESARTVIDLAAAYDAIDMELRDFDLIYAYPWPTEHTLLHNIVREFGNRSAMLLTYDAREGINLLRFPID